MTPDRNEQRMEDLESDIEETREDLEELTGDPDERKFIDSGKYEPVDDTIAP